MSDGCANTIGASVSNDTSTDCSEVQPFGPVTRRVYVPLAFTSGLGAVELKLFGPSQRKVAPFVVEAPVSDTCGLVQEIVFPLAEILGGAMSWSTVTVMESTHPFVAVAIRV